MAPYTPPTLHATFDAFAVTDWNAVANDVVFLYQRPYILASAAVAQSLPGAATTQMVLGATPSTGYGFSLSSNNAVVPLTGVYHVDAAGAMAANSNANACLIHVYHNGTPVIYGSAVVPVANLPVTSAACGLMLCSAGDTVGLWMFNGIAGPANSSAASTYLHLTFMGSQ